MPGGPHRRAPLGILAPEGRGREGGREGGRKGGVRDLLRGKGDREDSRSRGGEGKGGRKKGRTEVCESLRVFKELDELHHLPLGLVHARHVLERDINLGAEAEEGAEGGREGGTSVGT